MYQMENLSAAKTHDDSVSPQNVSLSLERLVSR